MRSIIGVTGAIGSGKTTFAEFVCRHRADCVHIETNKIIIEVANAFNRALWPKVPPIDIWTANQSLQEIAKSPDLFLSQYATPQQIEIRQEDISAHPELYEKLYVYLGHARQNPELLQSHITGANKQAYRALLQWLGGYLIAKADPDLWLKELFGRIEELGPDIKKVIITGIRYPAQAEFIQRRGGKVVKIERPNTETRDLTDLTERERDQIIPDFTIVNNGSMQQLEKVVERVLADYSTNTIRIKYSAARNLPDILK